MVYFKNYKSTDYKSALAGGFILNKIIPPVSKSGQPILDLATKVTLGNLIIEGTNAEIEKNNSQSK